MSENQDTQLQKAKQNSFDPKVIHGMVKMIRDAAGAKTACLLLETNDGNFHIVGDGAENSSSHVSLLLGATAHITSRIFSDLKQEPEPDQAAPETKTPDNA